MLKVLKGFSEPMIKMVPMCRKDQKMTESKHVKKKQENPKSGERLKPDAKLVFPYEYILQYQFAPAPVTNDFL